MNPVASLTNPSLPFFVSTWVIMSNLHVALHNVHRRVVQDILESGIIHDLAIHGC